MSGDHHQLRGAKPASPHTNRKGGYNKGEHLVVCDRSGKVYDSSNTRREWNGLIVGKDEWEPRHPQEFRRGIREDIAVKEARPGAPSLSTLSASIDDITAVSGGVASGVYTSGAADNTRPFVYWTLDLGSTIDLARLTLADLSLIVAPPPVARGIFVGHSTDGASYTDVLPAIGAFGGGVMPVQGTYVVDLNVEARYLRLALQGGRGLGFSGVLSHGALTVERNV